MSGQASVEPPQQLDQTEIHDILRNERRRHIISHLKECDETIAVSDLSEHIASVESGESPAPRNVRKSVYVSLHQTHLPKLDDWGIIDYDYRSKELTLLERVEEVEVYMEVVQPNDIPWGAYYLGLGVLALVTLLVTKLRIIHPTELGFEFWAWFYLVLVTLSAAYQTWENSSRKLIL